jgi:O-antigen/teichoic acid export membrane protein
LPKEKKDADSVALLGMCLVFSFSFASFCVVSFCRGNLLRIFNIDHFVFILYLVPLGIFLRGMLMILNSWYLREKAFKRMAGSLIFGSVGDRAVTIGYGLQANAGPLGLILGRYVGILLTLIGMISRRKGRRFSNIFSFENFGKIKKFGMKFKEFPKYAWSELILQSTVHMPIILLVIFFDPKVVAYFALTRRVLMEPIILVGEAIYRSFFQKASELHRDGKDTSELSVRMLHYLCFIVIFPMLFFGIFAREAFVLVFGEKWQQAGIYAQILVPLFIIDFIARPLNSFFDILIKQKEWLFFNLAFFSSSLFVFVALGFYRESLLCIGIYSAISTIIIAYRIFWLMSQVGIKYEQTIRIIYPYVLKAMLFLVPVLTVKIYFNDFFLILTVTILSICSYIIYYACLDNYMKKSLLPGIKHNVI